MRAQILVRKLNRFIAFHSVGANNLLHHLPETETISKIKAIRNPDYNNVYDFTDFKPISIYPAK